MEIESKQKEDTHIYSIKILDTLQKLPKIEVMHKFVHFNPMESYLDKNFLDAWLEFCDLLGIEPTLDVSDYEKFQLDGVLKIFDEPSKSHNKCTAVRSSKNHVNTSWRSQIQKSIKVWEDTLNFDLFYQTEQEWIKELSSITDQGISLFSQICLHIEKSQLPQLSQEERIVNALQDIRSICKTNSDSYFLLQEFIIRNRGWLGFLKTHRQSKNLWIEFKLDEIDAIEKFVASLKRNSKYFKKLKMFKVIDSPDRKNKPLNTLSLKLHSALERSVHQEICHKLSSQIPNTENHKTRKFFLLFCLDDRECSMRRHLENLSDEVETLGVPGFFGLPLAIVNQERWQYKSCPPLVDPSMLIYIEHPKGRFTTFLEQISNHLPGLNILLKRRSLLSNKEVKISWNALDLPFSEYMDHALGFRTLAECSEILAKFIKSFGINTKSNQNKEIIAVISHGGSSLNNPYYAAYDCAACSGNAGDLNARTLALIANDPRIREILRRSHDIDYSHNTIFLAVRHDTTTDEFKLFEKDLELNQRISFKNDIKTLKNLLQKAAGRNAIERCTKFEYKKDLLTEKKALAEVRKRGHSFFEPRPELGHAGCIAIIVCPRDWIKHINFERRAFLISYDPEQDKNSENLENILQAVLPVCTGISYDYFCSRMSKKIYGSGSKLSTSIDGLIGITQGTQGTLLTGLSWQMIEAHQPIRPLLIVSTDDPSIRSILKRNPLVSQYIQGNWTRVGLLQKSMNQLQTTFLEESWLEFEDLIHE